MRNRQPCKYVRKRITDGASMRAWTLCVIVLWMVAGAAHAQQLLVFAAASLKNSLDEVASMSPARATISYGASSALAKQIEAGAPADLFISADLDWMDYLE